MEVTKNEQMTKEEQWIKESIENYIFAYTGKRAKISDADAQHFTASVISYHNLCTPSLPSNLDEAAERYSCHDEDCEGAFYEPIVRNAFKAGAEWMAEVQQQPLVWKRIKQGERLPCRAYLYKLAYEQKGNFHGVATVDGLLVPNEPVRVGCDTWYLPADAVKNLPKEGQR